MIWTSTSSSPPHRAATVRTMIISFQDLVDDVLVHILCMLPLGDVLSVRQTSKQLQAITHLRAIWHYRFRIEVLSKGLPIPGTVIPLPEISALDLEWRTRFAIRVQKMWTHPSGPLLSVLRRSIPAAQQVVLRTGGRELLTLHSDRVITWRLGGTSGFTTENIIREHALGTDGAWKIYKGSGCFDTIAISNSSGGDVFIFAGPLDERPLQRRYSGKVLGLFDQFLFTSASPELVNNINIYSWVDPSFGVATIRLPPLNPGRPITIVGFDSHLILFWEAFLTIYPIPTLPKAGQLTILDPIQVFPLQSMIQTPIVCSPCTPLNLPKNGLALPSNPRRVKGLSIYRHATSTEWVNCSILSRNSGGEGADAPPFRLARTPLVWGVDCARMRVGHGGRALWWDSHGDVYRCSTVSIVTPEGSEHRTLDVRPQSLTPFCKLPNILKDQFGGWALDFDEGMGRIVYCNEVGLVSTIDVVRGPT